MQEYSLLGCKAVQFGESPTFRRNPSPPYSGLRVSQVNIQQRQAEEHIASILRAEK
jgi:hypothetical protein